LIVEPLFFLQIAFIELVESDNNIFFSLDVQREEKFLTASALHVQRSIRISRFVETNDDILKVCENILFFDDNLASLLLLVVLEAEGAKGTDDSIAIIIVD
jgi:hypothetical protein